MQLKPIFYLLNHPCSPLFSKLLFNSYSELASTTPSYYVFRPTSSFSRLSLRLCVLSFIFYLIFLTLCVHLFCFHPLELAGCRLLRFFSIEFFIIHVFQRYGDRKRMLLRGCAAVVVSTPSHTLLSLVNQIEKLLFLYISVRILKHPFLFFSD